MLRPMTDKDTEDMQAKVDALRPPVSQPPSQSKSSEPVRTTSPSALGNSARKTKNTVFPLGKVVAVRHCREMRFMLCSQDCVPDRQRSLIFEWESAECELSA